jgi:lincosamide nucleotidyltransferase B/F
MEATAFYIYTDRLRAALELAREVIGLVTLGTTVDSTFRDKWSDHDFWVITEAGAQDSFIKDLSWLPDAHNIAITVCHGERRRTVLYRNRHKVEFAVFDVNEAREGKIQRYRILIDRDHIAELIESIHKDTLKQAQARPDALQNLCVLVWSACERHNRGEFLSARQYLDGFAVNQLLSLLSDFDSETEAKGKDPLDPRRRLELRSPTLAEEVMTILDESVPEAALHLLEIAERELKPRAPTLAWENVTMVQGWLKEFVGSDAAG